MSPEERIIMVPVASIRVLNPRSRDAKRYQLITRSIRHLGLKVPIVVSPCTHPHRKEVYDLVCGQGRLEAFRAAGESEIPARVINVTQEDRLLMSLIENIARRQVKRAELVHEIMRLVDLGYSNAEVARKIDCSHSFIHGVVKLQRCGEERLLEAVMNEKISVEVANLMADATDDQAARDAIMTAYQSKAIPARSLASVKRLLDQREYLGKSLKRSGVRHRPPANNKEHLVKAYQREVDKQKRMARKARLCETRLVFATGAFTRLFRDENFVTLLRAEKIASIPEPSATW